jgi:hypothetical protein
MNTLALKTFLVAALFTFMATGSGISQAATLEGIVQGYSCMVVEKACAVDQNDPRVAAEKNFVVIQKDGTSYFITNVDASILAQNIFNEVRVTGDINNKYKSVAADRLEFFSKGAWHEAWSMAAEQEQSDELRMIESL